VLTTPAGRPAAPTCDFVIFPPRWMVAEHTFRPPWFHRNVHERVHGPGAGVYDAKAEGFLPGGSRLHKLHDRASARTSRPPSRAIAAER
jgi:homogentisate 1,2-dioxygenase